MTLALFVASVNGIAGIGHIVGGEFEVSLKMVTENEPEKDGRWKINEKSNGSTLTPKDEVSAISLLMESKFGMFGIFLQILCLFQIIGGLFLMFRATAGITLLAFFGCLQL